MAAGEGHAVEPGVRELLLDRQLPRFEAWTISTVVVDAGTQETYRTVRVLDPDQVWQTVPLMRLMAAVRELPARIWARPRGAAPRKDPKACVWLRSGRVRSRWRRRNWAN